MRIALISDVHGNLPAFEAVLADVNLSGVDEIWCLGDLVGYGAQPDECVELARKRCDLCLAGNHDLVVTGEIDIADFSVQRRRGGALDAGAHRTRCARRSCAASNRRGGRADRPLPRLAARPGLGVRAVHLAGGRVHGPDGPARGGGRPLARGALVPPREGRPRSRRAGQADSSTTSARASGC